MPFSQSHADVVCNFFERVLKHSGEWYGEPFTLAPWEEEGLSQIFGQIDDSDERVIKLAYFEVPKKAGKTEWVAGLVLLMLVLDKYPGCQVYGAASAQRQALNVYRAACAMVEQSPLLTKHLRILRGTHRIIKRKDPDSFYAAIAADGDLTDGVNPKFVVADELHRWKTRKQIENWDVLRLGGIARKQKTLTIAITTAGVQNESPLAWRLHEKTVRIKEGVIEDPTFFGRIYSADPTDDWTDERTWIKANPSLRENGGFLDIAKIREEYEASLSDPGSQIAFKRYYLNIWDQKENRAVDMKQWHACGQPWKSEGLQQKAPEDIVRPFSHDFIAHFIDRTCWAGVDLSMTTDMSAVSLVFPDDEGGYDVLPFFYMPADTIRKRELQDGMPYQRWAAEGFLELHDGTAIDYREIRARLKWASQMFDVREFCFDRYNSREMSTQMLTEGYECIEIPQIFTGISESTKKLLALIATGKLKHGGHPILTWNASCLCLKSDGNDLVRPVKPDREREHVRIDGISATITALARAIVAEQSTEVGVRMIG